MCLVAGGVYVFNDVFDRYEDLHHPLKKNRPIAVGTIPVQIAMIGASVLITIAVILAFFLSSTFFLILLVYLFINLAYSVKLKHVLVLDVLFVSVGFVLRAVAGAVVINVIISPWLIICTFFLALFLVLTKRRNELTTLENNGVNHRVVLKKYNPKHLELFIYIIIAAIFVSYGLYTLTHNTDFKFGNRALLVTIPFVVYGILRYHKLITAEHITSPFGVTIIQDKILLLNTIIWISVISAIIYF